MSIRTARRFAWAALTSSCVCAAGLAFAQTGALPSTTGEKLAGMSATALLGTGLIASLAVLGILVRFMAGEWMRQQKETVTVLQMVRDAIQKCQKGGV